MSWVNQPSVLLTTPPRSPFDETATPVEKHNALAQIVLVAAAGVAVYKKSLLPIIVALAFLIVNYLLCVEMNKNNMNYMQINEPVATRRPDSQQQPQMVQQPAQQTTPAGSFLPRWMTDGNACQCQPNLNLLETGDQLQMQQTWEGAPPTWGGNPTPQLYEYPNNPGRHDQPYAVRSRLPQSIRVTPDSSLARMFNSPNVFAMDQMQVPIPDSTLMARQPVCVQSPYTSSNVMRDGGKLRWIN